MGFLIDYKVVEWTPSLMKNIVWLFTTWFFFLFLFFFRNSLYFIYHTQSEWNSKYTCIIFHCLNTLFVVNWKPSASLTFHTDRQNDQQFSHPELWWVPSELYFLFTCLVPVSCYYWVRWYRHCSLLSFPRDVVKSMIFTGRSITDCPPPPFFPLWL